MKKVQLVFFKLLITSWVLWIFLWY